MKNRLVFGLIAMALSGMSGCGGATFDSLYKEMIANMNELNAALDSIKDDASADAGIAKIDKLTDKMKNTIKKAKELNPPLDESRKVEEANKKEFNDASKKFEKAGLGALQRAPGKRKEIGEALGKMASAMGEAMKK